MYRVLIVEDEEWIRRGIIKSIDWRALEMELAAEAANGEQALQILDNQHIDIVLTDMKMPVCDGRRLLQEIKARGLNCEVIVLSEYTDFEYTRQAIHAQVAEYLVKPIDQLQLNAVLRNVAERLSEPRLSLMPNSDSFDIVFLATLSRNPQIDFEAICEKYKSDFGGKCVVISVVQPELQCTNAYYDFLKSISSDAPYPTRMYPYNDGKNIISFFTLLPLACDQEIYSTYSSWLNSLFLKHLETQEGDIRIGTSTKIHDPIKLKEGLSSSLAALSYLHHGKGGITSADRICKSEPIDADSMFGEQHMIEFLSRCRKQDAEKLRQIFIDRLSKPKLLYIPTMRQALMDFAFTLEKCSKKAGYGLNLTAEMGENYIERIERIEWLQQVSAFLYEIIEIAFINISSKRSLTTADIVNEIINRIETHYMEDINLMQIAQHFHINYVHLSRQFKDRTGELFTDFLLRVRMTKARELIENRGFSEKDTAALVGYSNPYYFANSYKKYFAKEIEKNVKE